MPDPSASPPSEGYGPLIEVDDPHDRRLAPYRSLNDPARRAAIEADGSIFVVEGRLAVARLLESAYGVGSLLVDDRQVEAAGFLVTAARSRGVPVYVGSKALVAATVGFSLHRGVVAVARRPVPADPGAVLADVAGTGGGTGGLPVVAVLEGLNDHENLGALFRNAAAFGVAGVLLDPSCADPLYRRSVRVSVGHVLRVPFARLAPWPGGLAMVRAAGFTLAALAPDEGAAGVGGAPGMPLSALRPWLSRQSRVSGDGHPGARSRPRGVAVVLGAEGPGLSEGALAAADVVVSIPMSDGVDSLNVATAAAVAFHSVTNW